MTSNNIAELEALHHIALAHQDNPSLFEPILPHLYIMAYFQFHPEATVLPDSLLYDRSALPPGDSKLDPNLFIE